MKFRVIDNETGKEANIDEIVNDEEWQTALHIAILRDSLCLKAEALFCSTNAVIMNIARPIGSRSCSMENASRARESGNLALKIGGIRSKVTNVPFVVFSITVQAQNTITIARTAVRR